MSAVLDVVVKVTKDGAIEIDKIKRSADQAEKSTNKLERSSNKLSGSMGSMALKIGLAIGSMYALKKAFDFGASFVQTAAQFESFETTLESITGSSEKAKESMAWIEDFTSSTPFQLGQVTEAFVKMKSYGLEPTDGTLKTLGDTASAMGKDIVQAVEAMADAVTGENERLKEFGVKASVDGGKVAYAWSDSSGKARNIVIDNNKEMVQSTLNAIFNEKYVGAMDKQSKTWDGMVSNLADKWTLFKKDFMDEGLFMYLKGILGVIGDRLTDAFGDSKGVAKAFSSGVISGIKKIILFVGNMSDMFDGVKLVFKSLELYFDGFVLGVVDGVNTIDRYFFDMTERMRESLGGIGRDFTATMNDIKSFTGIGTIEVIEPFEANIYEPLISGQKELEAGLAKTKAEADLLLDSLIDEKGKKSALKLIADIDKKVAELTKTEKKGNKEKDKAKKLLDKLGAGYGTLEEKSKKASKTESDAIKEAQRQFEQTSDIFDSLFNADYSSAFVGTMDKVRESLKFDTVGDAWAKMFNSMLDGFEGFSESMDNMIKSSVWGFLLTVGLKAIQSLLSSKPISEAEYREAEGITTVLSDSVTNSIDTIADNGTLGLEHSQKMVDSLQSIVDLSNKSASNIDGGLTGEEYINSMEYGFFNNQSKELISSGIKLEEATIAELNAGQLKASEYVTEKITNSGFLGIGGGEELKTHNLGEADASVVAPINEAYLAGIDTLKQASALLGVGAQEFDASAESWTTSVSKLNFAGKSEAEIAEMINGAIGADLDLWAQDLAGVAGYIDEYKLAGEGQAETLIRLANEIEVVTREMGNLGLAMPDVAHGGLAVADALVQASGGMDKFLSNMDAFVSGFYSDAEQTAMKGKNLTASLQAIGLTMPATAGGFRALVEGLLATASASAMNASELLKLAESAEAMGDTVFATAYRLQYESAQLKADEDAKIASDALAMSSDFSSYFSGLESSAESASQALEEMQSVLVGIANLKAEWIGGIEGANLVLDSVITKTGITGVNNSNFLSAFSEASKEGLSSEELADWNGLSGALMNLESAIEEEKNAIKELAVGLYDLMDKGVSAVLDFNTTSIDKSFGSLEDAINNQDWDGASSSFGNVVKMANSDSQSTYKDRLFAIADANNMIQGFEKSNPNADIVKELKLLRKQADTTNDRLNEIEYNTHKANSTTTSYTKVVGQ